MKILALDLGKSKTVACEYDVQTSHHEYETVRTTPSWLQQLFCRRKPDRIVFEIGPVAGWVHDIAQTFNVEIQVANPNHESWRWRNTKSKTDRKDALKLAKLSAMHQLPLVYMPSSDIRQWRSLIRYRQTLIARRTAIKNAIRSILDRQGRPMKPGTTAWTAGGLASLYQLASPIEEKSEELWRGELFEELQCLAFIKERLERIEKKLNQIARDNARVALLQTIPGVGPRLAEALVAAIDDPHRFASRKEVSSYFGLAPRMFESGQMKRHGRISKEGSSLVRKLLIEVSWLGLRYNPWMRELFCRICAGNKSRKGIAIVTVARRLAVRAWAMLRDNSCWKMPECVSSEKGKVTAA